MAMVNLKGLYRVTAKGRVYWYAWRGGPRLLAPHGTPAFAAEYAAHHAARKGGDKDLISGLVTAFKASPAWTDPPERGGLAVTTKSVWVKCFDAIIVEFGKLRIDAFEDEKAARRRIKTWRDHWADRPRMADHMKQALSVLLSYAVDQERLTHNPCFGIANLYSSNRAEVIWTADDIAAFEASSAHPELLWALKLACLTGLRQSDLLTLNWSHVGELAVEFKTGKSRVRGSVQRTAVVPMHTELKALLATIPKRSTRVLTSPTGRPWNGFKKVWNRAIGKTDMKGRLHFHDARGTFATRAYLAGFKLAEIAVMLAWSEDKVERIINRYVLKDTLLRETIRRMDEARSSQ